MAKRLKGRIEIYAGPDQHGRYSYALLWWADYHPGHPDGEQVRRERGQHFFGALPQVTGSITDKRATKRGKQR